MSEQINYKSINAFPLESIKRLPDYVIFSPDWECEIILCSISEDEYKIFHRSIFDIKDDESFFFKGMKPFRFKIDKLCSIYPATSMFFVKNIDIIVEEYIHNKAGNAIGPFYKIKTDDVINRLLPSMVPVECLGCPID